MPSFWIEEREDSVLIKVRVQPRASRTELAGLHGDAIKVRLAAPPVDGAANAELIAFMAKTLSVAKSAVGIARGEKGKDKLIRVAGVNADRLRELF